MKKDRSIRTGAGPGCKPGGLRLRHRFFRGFFHGFFRRDHRAEGGRFPSPHAEILEQVKPILAEQGIDLQITEFDDYVMPNTAVEDGSLDANYFQHLPYLEDFNAKNGTHLASVGVIHYEPMGLYPGKSSDLANIPDGAKIGIPGDNTNGARALLLLEAQGVLKLKEGVGLEATELDIEENPHNVEIVPMEAANLPASLPDLDSRRHQRQLRLRRRHRRHRAGDRGRRLRGRPDLRQHRGREGRQ